MPIAHVSAAGEGFTATEEVSATTGEQTPIELQVTGTGDDELTVNLYVSEGTLAMSVTTGLSFDGSDTGNNLTFSGTRSNINAALETLTYQLNTPGEHTIEASIVSGEGEVYNPANKHVYQVITAGGEGITWDDAFIEASEMEYGGVNGYLVTITSEEENDFIISRLDQNGWMGANDKIDEGDWKWINGPETGTSFWSGGVDGDPVGEAFTNWSPGWQPDNAGNEDCGQVVISMGGTWNDLPCTNTQSRYVVEFGGETNEDEETEYPAVASAQIEVTVTPPTINIDSCEELQAIGSSEESLFAYYVQTANIDCSMTNPDSEYDNWNPEGTWGDAQGFKPIGEWCWDCTGFSGRYDGNGYEITDLFIDRNEDGVGLFGHATEDAIIEDVEIVDAAITNEGYVTGILGGLVFGTVNNSKVIGGSVDTTSYEWSYSTGGLIGAHNGTDTINNSSSSADVSGVSCVGGLVGENYGNIYGSSASGDVNGQWSVGGLVGCSSTWYHDESLDIHNSHATGNVYGLEDIGGLVGYIDSSDEMIHSLNNVYAEGDVYGQNDGDSDIYQIGGLLGEAYSIELTNSYAEGNVFVGQDEDNPENDFHMSDVGGLVGYLGDSSVQNSYAEGNVSSLLGSDEDWGFGGLVGSVEASTVESSYAEGDVTGTPMALGSEYGSGELGGLVGVAYGSTVTESHASGNVTGTEELGGLVGYGSTADVEIAPGEWEKRHTTITDSYSTGEVTGNYELGGLSGDMNGVSILRSYATGDVNGEASTYYDAYWDGEWIIEEEWEDQPGNIGGLVGSNDDVFVNEEYNEELEEWVETYEPGDIIQSYATGNVSGTEDVGGLVGESDILSIVRDSYSRGDVTGVGEEQASIGGGIGSSYAEDSVIENIYATGKVSADGEGVGGLIGNDGNGISGVNSFWDKQTTEKNTSDGGTGKTTDEMKNVSTFTNTATAGLDEPWDFVGNPNNDEGEDDIWSIDANANNGYPCLTWQANAELCANLSTDDNDNVPTEVENAGPNNGDANGDDILDSKQPYVSSLVNVVTGKYAVLEVDENCQINTVSIADENSNTTKDSGFNYQSGMMNFSVDCGEAGYQTTVKIYLYGVDGNGLLARKYNPNTSAYFTITGATISQQTIGGQSVAVVSYQATDGGELDIDNTANGIIIDPVGLASPAVGVPNTGL